MSRHTYTIRRKGLAALVAIALAAALLAASPFVGGSTAAEALGTFDTELLGHINEYRAGLGLDPLVEDESLQTAADSWATTIDEQFNGVFCDDRNQPTTHDMRYESQGQASAAGVPLGTINVTQGYGAMCGYQNMGVTGSIGHPSGIGLCAIRRFSRTTSYEQFCAIAIGRATRMAIEDPATTRIGLSTRLRFDGPSFLERQMTVTAVRLAGFGDACDSQDFTINMNRNGGNGIGTEGDDVILGTPGDDVIDGGGGNDIICAGDGDDQVAGGEGDDVIFGQAGNDVLRGNAGSDAIDGGDGADRILGGVDADSLIGQAGKDYIGGFGGDDTIGGGDNADTIFGGFGADVIYGGPGGDTVHGLVGDDIIHGDGGDDTLEGDRGNDAVHGGPGNDTVNGGNANDTVTGGNGDDMVNGGRGDDTLSGGDGVDTCSGNKQNVADSADASCNFAFGIP